MTRLHENAPIISKNSGNKSTEDPPEFSQEEESIFNADDENETQNQFEITIKVQEQLKKMLEAFKDEEQKVVMSDVWGKKKDGEREPKGEKGNGVNRPGNAEEGGIDEDKINKLDIKAELKKVLSEKQNQEPKQNKLDKYYKFNETAQVNEKIFRDPDIDYEKLLEDSKEDTEKETQNSQTTIESQNESQEESELEKSMFIDEESESEQVSEVESEQLSERVEAAKSQTRNSQVNKTSKKMPKFHEFLENRQSTENIGRVFVIENDSGNVNHLRRSKPSAKMRTEKAQKSQTDLIVLNSHLFNSKMRNKNGSFDRSKLIAQEISKLDNNLHKAGPEQLKPRRTNLNSFERRSKSKKRQGNIKLSFQENRAKPVKNISSMESVLKRATELPKTADLGWFPRTSKNQSRQKSGHGMADLGNSRVSSERENLQISGQRMNKENIFMALMYNRSQKNSSLREKKNFEKLFLKNIAKNGKEGKFELNTSNYQTKPEKEFSGLRNFTAKREYLETENLAERKVTLTKQNSPKWSRKGKERRATKYRVNGGED